MTHVNVTCDGPPRPASDSTYLWDGDGGRVEQSEGWGGCGSFSNKFLCSSAGGRWGGGTGVICGYF